MTDERAYHANLASDPLELRDDIQDVVDFGDGDTTAHVETGDEFNLNSIAIGFGVANIEYEPDEFSGLVYRIDKPEVTAILFHDGQITVIDGPDEEAAREATLKTVKRLEELGLYDGRDVIADDIEIHQA